MCKSAGMRPNLNSILDVRLYQAFDLDIDGRVLAGSDDTGSTQLIEIEPDGTTTPLTALPGACTGRYLPGQRAVIVSHDEDGDERHQLSLLRLPGAAEDETAEHDAGESAPEAEAPESAAAESAAPEARV